MRTLLIAFVLTACGASSRPATPPPPAPTGAAWETQSAAFLAHVAGAMDASGGDCAKLASGLMPLEPEAKQLKVTLDAAHHKLHEYNPEPKVKETFDRTPSVFDACEHDEAVARAMQATIFTAEPWEPSPGLVEAAGKGVGGMFAPH